MPELVVSVDVGTSSTRAGVLARDGALLGRAERPIDMNKPQAEHCEHDSEQIWAAVGVAVREALAVAGADGEHVAGISFDATCSLVVRDRDGQQLSVSTTGEQRWDTIVWLDHRALAEAEECTATAHRVLGYVGDVMSPEMEIPKLMWLRRRLPAQWAKCGYLFDLADFLTWKASGALARSQCTLTCKWTYLGHEDTPWQADFFDRLDMRDVIERGQLPARASAIGTDLGPLTAEAAATLGLTTDCRVGVGLIDAHAGALGVLGSFAGEPGAADRHLALIAGTSSCVMAMSSEPRPIHGVWGPYYGAVLPDYWLNEAGQSATGALLDHVIRWHSAGGRPDAAMHERVVSRVMELRERDGLDLAGRLHVLPDFHGNRSPLANPQALGVISGLTLDSSFDSLCKLYWRTAVSIALGVRHILDTLNQRGYGIEILHVTGGHLKNPLLMELYADAIGCVVREPAAKDAMLLGTGMVAATAAGLFPDIVAAARGMQRGGRERQPNPAARARFDRDYQVFLKMHEHRAVLDQLGAQTDPGAA
ncbi:MAG: FGGY-family carbohydrate kinase [Haliangiales bacterium]